MLDPAERGIRTPLAFGEAETSLSALDGGNLLREIGMWIIPERKQMIFCAVSGNDPRFLI